MAGRCQRRCAASVRPKLTAMDVDEIIPQVPGEPTGFELETTDLASQIRGIGAV